MATSRVVLWAVLLQGLVALAVLSEPTPRENVKDCRRHVEKALEQYWDDKDNPSQEGSNRPHLEHDGDHDDDDDDDDNGLDTRTLDNDNDDDDDNDHHGKVKDGDDDEEDDDDDEDDEADNQNVKNDQDDDDDDDEEDDNNRDDDDDDDNTKVDDDDDNKDDDDDDDDNKDDDEDDDKNDDDDENEATTNDDVRENKNVSDDEDDGNDDDDDDDDDEDDDKKVDDGETDEDEEQDVNDKASNESSDDDDDDDDDDNDDDDDDDANNQQQEVIKERATLGNIHSKEETSPVESKVKVDSRKGPEGKATTETSTHTSTNKELDQSKGKAADDDEDDDEDIENIYDDDDADDGEPTQLRRRDHVDAILGVVEESDAELERAGQATLREIRKIQQQLIKPVEQLYKYADATTRHLTDAEIFNKPIFLFLGPWSTGKTTIINYLLGIERTPMALKTGPGLTDTGFTVLTYGEQRRVTSGAELSLDWRYSGLQKFGPGVTEHLRGISLPCPLLKKVTLVDSPGIVESGGRERSRGFDFKGAFRWLADRADAVYVVLEPAKLDVGVELGAILSSLHGAGETRFVLNKADDVRRGDLMRVVGQLFWNLSPLLASAHAPVISAVSLRSQAFDTNAPHRFLADQERNLLSDMRDILSRHVESRILYARRHAVRVRNHAKLVDCYLNAYYRQKSIFSSKKTVAKQIVDHPSDFRILDGLSRAAGGNVSRADMPDADGYSDFFRLHPLYEFKLLTATCSYFRGCPMERLDQAISKDIPELLARHLKFEEARQQEHQ